MVEKPGWSLPGETGAVNPRFGVLKLGTFPSPLGWVGYAWQERTVVATVIGAMIRNEALGELLNRLRELRPEWQGHFDEEENAFITEFLANYFEKRPVAPSEISLDLGPLRNFTRPVLLACREIPWGKLCSYRALAEAIGAPGAARAVGGALRRNPFPILIPCHRVVRSDGSLGGYQGREGLELKLRLLQHEGHVIEQGKIARLEPSLLRPAEGFPCFRFHVPGR